MIHFSIFKEQNDKILKSKEIRKQFKKDKKDVSERVMFYYLLKNRYKNPKLELRKFTMDECSDGKTFLKYNVSTFRKKRNDKFIPILEEVKFKELILDMPDDSSGSLDPTAKFCLLPSGIIIDEIFGDKKQVQTPTGIYNNVRKFRLLIPQTYFKSVSKKNIKPKTKLNAQK